MEMLNASVHPVNDEQNSFKVFLPKFKVLKTFTIKYHTSTLLVRKFPKSTHNPQKHHNDAFLRVENNSYCTEFFGIE